MRRAIGAVVGMGLLVAAPGAAKAEWTAAPVAGSGCVLESTAEAVNDGYQNTTARLRVDGKAVTVTSPSVFDPGFKDIGIAVDDEPLVPMDRLADPRTAVFESHYAALVERFKRGLRARLQLRFWPTWPATGTHSATVSLVGFTRAHARMPDCQ
jgi:hypothetical protein